MSPRRLRCFIGLALASIVSFRCIPISTGHRSPSKAPENKSVTITVRVVNDSNFASYLCLDSETKLEENLPALRLSVDDNESVTFPVQPEEKCEPPKDNGPPVPVNGRPPVPGYSASIGTTSKKHIGVILPRRITNIPENASILATRKLVDFLAVRDPGTKISVAFASEGANGDRAASLNLRLSPFSFVAKEAHAVDDQVDRVRREHKLRDQERANAAAAATLNAKADSELKAAREYATSAPLLITSSIRTTTTGEQFCVNYTGRVPCSTVGAENRDSRVVSTTGSVTIVNKSKETLRVQASIGGFASVSMMLGAGPRSVVDCEKPFDISPGETKTVQCRFSEGAALGTNIDRGFALVCARDGVDFLSTHAKRRGYPPSVTGGVLFKEKATADILELSSCK